jgi:hypothetical protein
MNLVVARLCGLAQNSLQALFSGHLASVQVSGHHHVYIGEVNDDAVREDDQLAGALASGGVEVSGGNGLGLATEKHYVSLDWGLIKIHVFPAN